MDARFVAAALGLGALALWLVQRQQASAAAAPIVTYDYGPEPAYAPPYVPSAPAIDWTTLDLLDWGDWAVPEVVAPTVESPPVQTQSPTEPWQAWDFFPEYPTPLPEPEPAPSLQYDWEYGYAPVPAPTTAPIDPEANMRAVLAMIGYAEGTDPNAYGWNPYGVTVGYEFQITNFLDHPANLGWRGNTRTGVLSTAAGKYQFLQGTWNDIKRAIGVRDFSPTSQERAARWLIDVKRAPAGTLIREGRLPEALDYLSYEWASLVAPSTGTGRYGQPIRSLDQLSAIYQSAGGVVA